MNFCCQDVPPCIPLSLCSVTIDVRLFIYTDATTYINLQKRFLYFILWETDPLSTDEEMNALRKKVSKIMKKFIERILKYVKKREEILDIAKWLYKNGKNFKRYMLGFLIINFITMMISLASSIAGRYVVDAATAFKSDLFFRYIMIMLATSLLSILISSIAGMFSSYVGEKYAFGIRATLYDQVQRSEWYKLSQFHSGDLLARLSSDVDTISSTLITLIPNLIVTICQILFIVLILLKNDPTLVIIGLIVGPLGMIASVLFRKKYTMYQKDLRESHSEYYSFMQESLASISVTKTFQLENKNNLKFQNIRDKRLKLVMKSFFLSNIMSSFMRLVYSIGYVITFSWCAYNLTISDISGYTYGTMTLFLSLTSQLQGSIRSLGHVIPQLFTLFVSGKRLYEITEIENEDYTPIVSIPKEVGLRAQNVSFSYEDEDFTVLDNITFDFPANCRIGIVGTSGAGKTTFIRMLLSLLKPTKGTLEYVDENGNLEPVCPASRRFISYVPQGNTLMSGSVRSNLLAGKADATEEEMWNALEMADAATFLKKTANGLDTVLTESAGGISEGQAQRVAIARALLRDKPVLILDEATSALDEKTEARIFERIAQTSNKTCFIITHRRSMLQYCNIVMEIDDDGNATIQYKKTL